MVQEEAGGVVAVGVIREADEELSSDDDEAEEEAQDSFPTTATPAGGGSSPPPAVLIARDSLALVNRTSQQQQSVGGTAASTADLATMVGSVLLSEKEAFLKSFTFIVTKEQQGESSSNEPDEPVNLGLTFRDRVKRGSRWSRRRPGSSSSSRESQLYIDTVDENGLFFLSRIRSGDYLKTINGRKVGPSLLNGDLALQRMHECLQRDGFLSVSTKNKEEEADDILVHATILKPTPDMTYDDLGMVVWYWGYLCIKEIKKHSIFKHSVLRETDNIVSINEIKCIDMKNVEDFATIIAALPREVTITVLRRKERLTGRFG